jgi:hypothetical protein
MKKFLSLSVVMITLVAVSCNAQTNPKPASVALNDSDIEVYYFHMTTRCVTCRTVEAEARKNVEMLYPELAKNGKISFTALNIEEATGKAMGEKLGVNSQTLLIVKGDRKINITNEGFLYAVSQPQKFTEIMKSKIDLLLIR